MSYETRFVDLDEEGAEVWDCRGSVIVEEPEEAIVEGWGGWSPPPRQMYYC